jgi:putative hydrolase of the HAD superfamily
MTEIRALFWDVGGVLLSNAWDHTQRADALAKFGLDEKEFSARHELVVSSFERGKISLDEYLELTVFYTPRPFSPNDFRDYMLTLSQPMPEVLDFARALAASGKYFLGTLNNESRELNLYRMDQFHLREIFRLFVSSCFVGLRKPETGIYQLALDITQIPPPQCCFLDDRALNLECAARLGMKTIQMKSLAQLKESLSALGVAP